MKRRLIFALAAAVLTLRRNPLVAALRDSERESSTPLRVRPTQVAGDDDTSTLQQALDHGGTIELEPGEYRVARTLEIAQPGTRLVCRGSARIYATDTATDEYIVRARGLANLTIENITFDANGLRRKHLSMERTVALALIDCTDSKLHRVSATGASGRPGHSGVGIAIGGVKSRRISLTECRAFDCGAPGRPADGIYCSASDSLIADCVAENCYDTGFVLEKCSNSGIKNCTSTNCSAAAAITNTLDDAVERNYIDGLTAKNWQAKNTGGIQIGCLRPGARGDLLKTRISNVTMVIDRPDRGDGPALNIRSTATAKVRDIQLENLKIVGATRQGILIAAEDYTISRTEISQTVDACIQIQDGSENGMIQTTIMRGGSFGIIATNGGQLRIENADISGQVKAAIYLRGKSKLMMSGRNVVIPSAKGLRITTETGASAS